MNKIIVGDFMYIEINKFFFQKNRLMYEEKDKQI